MSIVLLNDKLIAKEEAAIDFDDRGYYFGDGIYEVVRFYNGKPFTWKEHLERFQESARQLDIPLPMNPDDITGLVKELASQNQLNGGIVYLQMTRGAEERNHLYDRNLTPLLTGFCKELSVPHDKQQNGIAVYSTEDIRWLRCDIKTVNLLGNVMAKRKAADHECEEAIQHRDDIVTEGSSTNVFIVKDGTLHTHPANHFILNGITRKVVLRLALELGIQTTEEPFHLQDLVQADEVFVTSTTMEVTPVVSITGSIDAKYEIGPVTRKLQHAFTSRTLAL